MQNEDKNLRLLVRQVLTEALTKSDKKEIERIARKQAKIIAADEIERAVGKDFKKTIKKEIEKILKDTATKDEIAKITKSILIKFHRSLSQQDKFVIEKIKP